MKSTQGPQSLGNSSDLDHDAQFMREGGPPRGKAFLRVAGERREVRGSNIV